MVILGTNLVKSAVEKWNLKYMEENMSDGLKTVYFSKTHIFKYFDDTKMLSRTNSKGVEFTPPIRKVEMSIKEFIKRTSEWKQGEER